jgi:hypothetical protein
MLRHGANPLSEWISFSTPWATALHVDAFYWSMTQHAVATYHAVFANSRERAWPSNYYELLPASRKGT